MALLMSSAPFRLERRWLHQEFVTAGRCTSSYGCVSRCESGSLCCMSGRCGLTLPGLWSLTCGWLFSSSESQCGPVRFASTQSERRLSRIHVHESASFSHVCTSIPELFRSRLQVSLKRSLGRPRGLDPTESSPYSRSFGILPSSIRCT